LGVKVTLNFVRNEFLTLSACVPAELSCAVDIK